MRHSWESRVQLSQLSFFVRRRIQAALPPPSQAGRHSGLRSMPVVKRVEGPGLPERHSTVGCGCLQ